MASSMTKTERTELRRIIKTRFTILERAVAEREAQLLREVRESICDERAEEIKTAQAELDALVALYNETHTQLRDMLTRFAENGLTANLGNSFDHQRIANPVVGLHRLDMLTLKRLNEIKTTAGYHGLNLAQEQAELEETLAFDSLESESARDFLARVPTVDKLLPPDMVRRSISDGG